MIKIGSGDIGKVYAGSTEIAKAYVGSQLVYEADSGTPSLLPAGYTEVPYISSDGTEYVNTGIVQKSRNFVLEMKFAWTGSDDSQFETFFGYMAASSTTPRSTFNKYQGKWMFGTNITQTTSVSVDGNVHIIRIEGKASENKEYLYLDGTLIGTANTSSSGISNNSNPSYIFARSRKTSIDNPASADVYYIKYTRYGESSYTTVSEDYDFVPCYNSNGDYGFYDIVNDVFHAKTLI